MLKPTQYNMGEEDDQYDFDDDAIITNPRMLNQWDKKAHGEFKAAIELWTTQVCDCVDADPISSTDKTFTKANMQLDIQNYICKQLANMFLPRDVIAEVAPLMHEKVKAAVLKKQAETLKLASRQRKSDQQKERRSLGKENENAFITIMLQGTNDKIARFLNKTHLTPAQYDNLLDLCKTKALLTMDQHDVAQYIIRSQYMAPQYVNIPDSFIDGSSSLKNKPFYQFDNTTGLWEHLEVHTAGHSQKVAILNHIIGIFTTMHGDALKLQTGFKTLTGKEAEETTPDKKKMVNCYAKNSGLLVKKLASRSFASGVWQDVTDWLTIESLDRFDPISPIIPMNNGKNIDIFTGEIIQRSVNDINKYTHSFNAHLVESITSFEPIDDNSLHATVYGELLKFTCGDKAKLLFLLKMIGIYISGDVSDKTILILVGEGNDGKSAFINLISAIVGKAADTVAPGVIFDTGMASSANSHTAHIDHCKGLRLGTKSEGNKGFKAWNLDLIKQFSGSDKVYNRAPSAADKSGNVFPIHLIVAGNPCDFPPLPSADKACESRFMFFLFSAFFDMGLGVTHTVTPVKTYDADRNFKARFSQPDYLNMVFTLISLAVRGHDIEANFTPPDYVKRVTENFMSGGFLYQDFVDLYCITDPLNRDTDGRLTMKTHVTKIHTAFKALNNNILPSGFKSVFASKFNLVKSGLEYYYGVSINEVAIDNELQRIGKAPLYRQVVQLE